MTGYSAETIDARTRAISISEGMPTEVLLVKASTITPEPIRWLWNGYLARGKLHILAGAPGTGKTTLALSMAATITRGGRWPDGTRPTAGDVLIWSGEDDPADTLTPRLMAAGADLERCHLITGSRDDDGLRAFDPARDMPALAAAALPLADVALLMVDPLVSAVAGDSHKNAETRRALQPLVDLAGQLGAAVIGISHYTKGTQGRDPTERVTGSLAFGALARLVLATGRKEGEDGPQLVMVRAKSNIGPQGGGWAYELRQGELDGRPAISASSVHWRESLTGDARSILGEVEGDDSEERTERSEAAEWLAEVLAAGAMPAREVEKLAKLAGYCWRTVQRARSAAGAVAKRSGFGKGSVVTWAIGDIGAIDANTKGLAPMAPMASMGDQGEVLE
jgi:putative DNA primase/helicase